MFYLLLGCANGGAQIRPSSGFSKELLSEVEQLYYSVPVKKPKENEFITELYDSWLGGSDTLKAKQMLHTQYHAIEKSSNPLLIKW